ncbi:hypothetical protein [endosymbiont 'TC1' of Trimyema compressum]|uniref:hypothetical protein n=1 Tax=endosymbiont 'TC1' of Trimyema compressum TaxID=243899 RepID=UPI002480B322|nr:hypothetical protein [endosymbiont 'TC1' of Trimyema compressum]
MVSGVRHTLVGGHDWMAALAKYSQIPVYNMQCDIWHPTQALADLFTIREKFGRDLRKKNSLFLEHQRQTTSVHYQWLIT